MPDPTPQKQKAPALDQAQAMAVTIPGALSAPMLVDVPVELPPADPTFAEPASGGPPSAPMLADVPIDLPEIVPDPEPDNGRPASDALKDAWVAWAISRGVPSYEAWALTLPELKKMEA